MLSVNQEACCMLCVHGVSKHCKFLAVVTGNSVFHECTVSSLQK